MMNKYIVILLLPLAGQLSPKETLSKPRQEAIFGHKRTPGAKVFVT
jgi:hypothetical protein